MGTDQGSRSAFIRVDPRLKLFLAAFAGFAIAH
jgi:hypothetical protein